MSEPEEVVHEALEALCDWASFPLVGDKRIEDRPVDDHAHELERLHSAGDTAVDSLAAALAERDRRIEELEGAIIEAADLHEYWFGTTMDDSGVPVTHPRCSCGWSSNAPSIGADRPRGETRWLSHVLAALAPPTTEGEE